MYLKTQFYFDSECFPSRFFRALGGWGGLTSEFRLFFQIHVCYWNEQIIRIPSSSNSFIISFVHSSIDYTFTCTFLKTTHKPSPRAFVCIKQTFEIIKLERTYLKAKSNVVNIYKYFIYSPALYTHNRICVERSLN